jgi:hypothetical protein
MKYPSSEKMVGSPAESPDKRCTKILELAFTSEFKNVEYQGKEITPISTGKMV